MPKIVRERIEMSIDVETQQLAEQVAKELASIVLSNAQFDKFVEVCNAQHNLPTRLKLAAQILDKEGF